MSVHAPPAAPVLEPLAPDGGEPPRHIPGPSPAGILPALSFAGLALYGALRWGILLTPSPTPRLLGLAALAVLVALGGRALHRRRTWGAVLAVALAIPVALVLAGVPVAWIVDARIAVTWRWISDGVSALPAVLLPYEQADEWVRIVITGGAAALLVAAGAVVALGRPTPRRRAWAALPLLVVGLTPSVLIRPGAPTLHGLLLLALLVGFVWGDRVPRDGLAAALGLAGAAALAAVALAPAVDPHRPWLNVQALASRLGPKAPAQFTFDQQYGPLSWPQAGRRVFDVRAARADYWKVEDLTAFDGLGFVAGTAPAVGTPPAPDAAAQARFSQRITVTIRGLTTSNVIAAGDATPPSHLSRNVSPGLNPGTYVLSTPLRPGDSYTTTTYSPEPTAAQLARAGNVYPEAQLVSDRTVLLPTGAPGTIQPLLVPPFHSSALASGALTGPYTPVFALAQRLESTSATPYDFVARVMAFLAHGYIYDQNPPPSPYPLVSFLFRDRVGYCQQFSGAMALLLRLGGLPARVAGGFTPGVRDSAGGQWIVSDVDAHDWVEVWFPHYGWVRFDPTPAVAPARATSAAVPDPGASPRALGIARPSAAAPPRAPRSGRGPRRPPSRGRARGRAVGVGHRPRGPAAPRRGDRDRLGAAATHRARTRSWPSSSEPCAAAGARRRRGRPSSGSNGACGIARRLRTTFARSAGSATGARARRGRRSRAGGRCGPSSRAASALAGG